MASDCGHSAFDSSIRGDKCAACLIEKILRLTQENERLRAKYAVIIAIAKTVNEAFAKWWHEEDGGDPSILAIEMSRLAGTIKMNPGKLLGKDVCIVCEAEKK